MRPALLARPSVLLSFILAALSAGCGVDPGWSDPAADAQKAELYDAELEIIRKLQPGDIFLTSGDEGNECWYLNWLQNAATRPRYCHAGLILAADEEGGVTTLEALNKSQGIQIVPQSGLTLVYSTKVAVLRVVNDDGSDLTAEEIASVLETALQWVDAPYSEPPIRLDGDPLVTGLYCSMLPYRAYLDALGIDLDALTLTSSVLVPFIVTPDELYESKNVWPVLELAPESEPVPDDFLPGA